MNLGGATEAIVIYDAERGITQLGGSSYQLERMGGSIEKAVVGVAMELCISDPCV